MNECQVWTSFSVFNNKGKDYFQAACSELNTRRLHQIGEFNDDEYLLIENLTSGMGLVIDSSIRISDGKVWSFVSGKEIRV